MPDEARPIICRSLVVKEAIPGEFGGVVGYRERMPAASLTIRLKRTALQHTVGQDNRVTTNMEEAMGQSQARHLRFTNGTLQVSPQQIRDTGMQREEIVAFLREGAERGQYEVLGEDLEDKRDVRKPGVPVGAGAK